MQEGEKLVRRFKSKDLTAFDEIFSKYHKPIYFFVYKMVFNSATADDLVQDTFLKVFKGLKDVPDNVNLSAWIYRIAHNVCIDHLRKNKISYEIIDNIEYEDNENNNPEKNCLNREINDKIKHVMIKIGSKYRTVLILRDYNDLSYKEIANILRISEAAVKSLIHRARQLFQRIYVEED